MKLKNLFKINKNALKGDHEDLSQSFRILRSCISKMFPNEHRLDLTKEQIDDAKIENNLAVKNIGFDVNHHRFYNNNHIQFHTRDNEWLAKYMLNLAKDEIKQEEQLHQYLQKLTEEVEAKYPYINKEYQNLPYKNVTPNSKITLATVKKFIETDSEFEIARINYEADIIRAQIEFMISSNQPNGLLLGTYNQNNNDLFTSTNYHPFISRLQKNTDKLFRQGAINSLKLLGIDQHLIEVNLEKHANLWRNDTMQDAFFNQHPIPLATDDYLNLHTSYYMREILKLDWLRQREYQYYQDHKEIIDELNLATPNMKMTKEEAEILNQQVALLEDRFKNCIQPTKSTGKDDMMQ